LPLLARAARVAARPVLALVILESGDRRAIAAFGDATREAGAALAAVDRSARPTVAEPVALWSARAISP